MQMWANVFNESFQYFIGKNIFKMSYANNFSKTAYFRVSFDVLRFSTELQTEPLETLPDFIWYRYKIRFTR